MDKLKKSLKKLLAPAVVLLLVAVMGIFSPVISVAAALHLNTAAVTSTNSVSITNLPARTVKVGTTINVPTISDPSNNTVELWHAGKMADISSGEYYFGEVGQYEWRFYVGKDANKVLFDTYKVTATKASYTMSMPSNVVTVVPKGLSQLVLPLPESFTVNGDGRELVKFEGNATGHYAVVTLKNKKKKSEETYRLYATVSLENSYLASDKLTFGDKNMTIDMTDYQGLSGNLKVTYSLKENKDGGSLLVALPLNTIEIKNVNKDDVTFANIPTAPSVANLSYYSEVALSTPAADSAKIGKNSFSVEAQTSIVKVQAYLFANEPKAWSVNSNTTDKTQILTFTTENGKLNNEFIEIDGLNVKVKKLGWFRFQFQTSTLFGYKLDSDFSNDAVVQNGDNVQYWSDTVKIYRDTVSPDFAWVKDYNQNDDTQITDLNQNYSELKDFDGYFPLESQPDSTTTKKITVNPEQGLSLPAIFPHDNATDFANLEVSAVSVEQIKTADGNPVEEVNKAVKGSEINATTFKYDMTQPLKIKFADNAVANQGENEVTLKSVAGLYRVTIAVRDQEPRFEGNNEKYSSYDNARSYYKYLYFFVDSTFTCDNTGVNSPVIDEEKTFQVSDVYKWEGDTFDFKAPSFNDEHTPTNDLKISYYLVNEDKTSIQTLDYTAGASRVTVDMSNLTVGAGKYYIYAVAQNFNGLQANLKHELGTAVMTDDAYFHSELFATDLYKNEATVAQYGYAWKRAEFNISDSTTGSTATLNAVISDAAVDNSFKAGKPVKISSITANWGAGNVVDGRMSIAVYSKQDHKRYNIYNSNNASAEIVSSVSFKRESYTLGGVDKELYFTPDVKDDYILVVTAKENSSSNVSVLVKQISIEGSDEWHGYLDGMDESDSDTVTATMTLGNSLTLPTVKAYQGNDLVYVSHNRELIKVSDGSVAGDCVIAVMGEVSDPYCVTGNKFTPTETGKHKIRFDCYLTGAAEPFYSKSCVIQVNAASTTSNILMGEEYNKDTLLLNGITETSETDESKIFEVEGKKYLLGANDKNKADAPAYAITLEQFKNANYGDKTDFVVNSAYLYDYLEPIYDGAKISSYMYPAIAIPMPNVVSGNANSDDVEITVQKSGSSSFLVSSKQKKVSGNKESVIAKINGYYVFRPEGTFFADVKTNSKYNANNFTALAASTKSIVSGVYTVTYKVGSSSVSYNITFGNLENGQVKLNEGFLTYNDGKEDKNINESSDKLIIDKDSNGHRYITIDMSKFAFNGNESMLNLINENDNPLQYYWNKVNITVTYEDGTFISSSDWSTANDATKAIKDSNNYTYKFDLTEGSGTYKVTAELYNNYTSSTVSSSIEFSLDAESTNKNVNLNTVWGIILIVLSVGLLAGVIFYFVKTARATRFVDAPRALKGKDKKAKQAEQEPKAEKETTKSVAAPKTEEAPKKDAK